MPRSSLGDWLDFAKQMLVNVFERQVKMDHTINSIGFGAPETCDSHRVYSLAIAHSVLLNGCASSHK